MTKNTYKIDKKEQKEVKRANERTRDTSPSIFAQRNIHAEAQTELAQHARATAAGLPVRDPRRVPPHSKSDIAIAESHKRAVERSNKKP